MAFSALSPNNVIFYIKYNGLDSYKQQLSLIKQFIAKNELLKYKILGEKITDELTQPHYELTKIFKMVREKEVSTVVVSDHTIIHSNHQTFVHLQNHFNYIGASLISLVEFKND